MQPDPTTEPDADPRRDALLDAALELLREQGYRDTTMLQIATRARASKNTLYRHFETKDALFAALVARASRTLNAELDAAFAAGTPLEPTLERFGESLLRLLTGPTSVAINRAAIAEATSAPGIGRALAESGRGRTGPLAIRYLRRQSKSGVLRPLDAADAAEAFETFVGLLVGDLQVRVLAGTAAAPDDAQVRRRARAATRRFVKLFGAK